MAPGCIWQRLCIFYAVYLLEEVVESNKPQKIEQEESICYCLQLIRG